MEGDTIVQIFLAVRMPTDEKYRAGNYMAYNKNRLRSASWS